MTKVINFNEYKKEKEIEKSIEKASNYLDVAFSKSSLYQDQLNRDIFYHLIEGVLYHATFKTPIISINMSGVARDFNVTNYTVKKVFDDLVKNEIFLIYKREKGKPVLVNSLNLLAMYGENALEKHQIN